MSRLNSFLSIVAPIAFLAVEPACGGASKEPMVPEASSGLETEPGASQARDPSKACAVADMSDVQQALNRSECEVASESPEHLAQADLTKKLTVQVTASPTRVKPGSQADLIVTFTNQTDEPLPLFFKVDPLARFETETWNAKQKRVDLPATKPPSPPKGASENPMRIAVARVVLDPHAHATVHLSWTASSTRWAPEQARGAVLQYGYPRVPASALAKGTYSVVVRTPLVGVAPSQAVFGGKPAPTVDIEVAP